MAQMVTREQNEETQNGVDLGVGWELLILMFFPTCTQQVLKQFAQTLGVRQSGLAW